MPPKRKSGANNEETEGKRARVFDELDTSTVRWEWEADGGRWEVYDIKLNDSLTAAYNQSEKEVEFSVGGGACTMRVILGKMVQKNKATGWERRVRCATKSKETDYVMWEYEDENGHWCAYSIEHTLAMEKAMDGGEKSTSITLRDQLYNIDLDGLTQTNDDSGFERKLRRTKSTASMAPLNSDVTIADTQPASKTAGKSNGTNGTTSTSSSSSTAKSGKGKSSKSSASSRNQEENVKTVKVVKGTVPVDPECTAKVGSAHVYIHNSDIYDVMLNQTNINQNNNKYFIIQLLKDDNRNSYNVWFRWGRVGYSGQSNLVPCGPDLEEAKQVFVKKFQDKTKNLWTERKHFKKVPGKYDLVVIDYGAQDAAPLQNETTTPKNVPASKLPPSVQDLIQLICNVKAMEEMVLEMKYDARKAPLGKLSVAQIKAGYVALKKIDALVQKDNYGPQLGDACSEFYTRIPHDFGMTKPPLIRTKEEIKLKIKLLELLDDIEIAMKIISQNVKNENPLDTHYNSLNCQLSSVDKDEAEYKMIEQYVTNTHATTHSMYKMKVLDVFTMDRKGEAERYNDVGNKMLLWHGSRLTNWMGILSQGLRIAPPEAPVTGYMFGKGVYFADMSSKSANYCYPTRINNTGLMLACEVSLGKCHELLAADYDAATLPAGKHSVKGLGKMAPNPAHNSDNDDVMVPLGKQHNTGVTNPDGYTLNYNEYIVYNPNQIKMRYLVKVQFDF